MGGYGSLYGVMGGYRRVWDVIGGIYNNDIMC